MATFDLNMQQLSIVKHAVRARQLQLEVDLKKARRAQHDIAILNTEADLKEILTLMVVLNAVPEEAER